MFTYPPSRTKDQGCAFGVGKRRHDVNSRAAEEATSELRFAKNGVAERKKKKITGKLCHKSLYTVGFRLFTAQPNRTPSKILAIYKSRRQSSFPFTSQAKNSFDFLGLEAKHLLMSQKRSIEFIALHIFPHDFIYIDVEIACHPPSTFFH